MDIPTTEPSEIVAGDTLKWNRQDLSSDYPASAGWVLTYELRGPKPITITASADGDYFSVVETAATTAVYTAGDYKWAAYVTKTTERYEVDSGSMTVLQNLAAVTGDYEPRSHVKITLDNIQAVLRKRSTKDQDNYAVSGRALSRTPLNDLMDLEKEYLSRYQAEQDKEAIDNGKSSGNKVRVSFTKP